jgi:hypothetical protein
VEVSLLIALARRVKLGFAIINKAAIRRKQTLDMGLQKTE